MKKGSFAGLLYREYYLGKHSYITGMLFFMVHVLIGWLAILSMKYGNLGLLIGENSDGSIIKNQAFADLLRLFVITAVKYMPCVMAAMIGVSPADVSSKDTLNKWNRFEHSTPVTPVRYAAVKTISTVIAEVLALLLAVVYMFLIQLVLGERFTYGDFSVIVVFISLFSISLCILPQIFITLLKRSDLGWLCSMFTLTVPVFIISIINSNQANAFSEVLSIEAGAAVLTEKAQQYCPLALAVLGIAFVVLFASMYLLYKRREP